MDDAQRISQILPINTQAIRNLQIQAAQVAAQQVELEDNLSMYFELAIFAPLYQTRFRSFEELRSHLSKNLEDIESAEELKVIVVTQIDETAVRYQRNNEELNARTLLILRSRLLEGKPTAEEILEKTLETYSDRVLADESLDFLIETAEGDAKAEFQKAKELLNERYGLEIKAGRNVGVQSRAFSKEGLGDPSSLRDLYKEIIYNPREAIELFDQLAEKFPFGKLKQAISFLLNALGSDFRSRGPSISRPELKRLIDETRSLQGILGVYRFFQSRMRLIEGLFSKYQLVLPQRVNFELLSRIFIKILAERYMNAERILMTAKLLGISEEKLAQLIVYNQMKDAIKQVAPRYYRNQKHKDDVLNAFIDLLEDLDEDEEEEEEKKK